MANPARDEHDLPLIPLATLAVMGNLKGMSPPEEESSRATCAGPPGPATVPS